MHMKLINEKGKLFGIINVVDLICLLILLLALAGIGWKILGPKVQESVAPATEMTTTLRIRGAYAYMLRQLEENPLTGEQLISGNGYVDAYVTDMYYEPYIVQAITDDGTIVDAEDPTKRDVIVVVKSTIARGAAILKIGNQEVRAGRTYILKTRFFETNANIDSVTAE